MATEDGLLGRASSAPELGEGDDDQGDAWPVRRGSGAGCDPYQVRGRRGSSASMQSAIALNLTGIDGATSLKEELVGRVPMVNDAPTFREIRRLVREDFHGAMSVLEELIISGYVDPETLKMNTGDQPFNVFARFGAGLMEQPGMQKAQEVLGDLSERFVICRNKAEYDSYWDSEDPKRIRKASMSRRHRFLTTKNLDWEWFNALTFGLLPIEDGGVGLHVAIREVEAMKTACLRYASTIGGWSEQVGLFVNVFGHNNMNSLFIHILDMSCLGPAFEYQKYKNLPVDAVLKVLREEAISQMPPRASLRERGLKLKSRSRQAAVNVCVDGTSGATSLKSETAARFPDLRDAGDYRHIRRVLRAELGGASAIFGELARAGFVDRTSRHLTTGTHPFNVFARIAAGELVQPGMESEQAALGQYQSNFVICCNRAENDEHWDSEDPEWLGKASMSLRHRFLTTKDLHWQWFNALVFGLVPSEEGGVDLPTVLTEIERMKAAALHYTRTIGGWSKNVGLFVHVYGHNSVNSLHVHILDMAAIGPTFRIHFHKNCPLDDVYKVLKEEHFASQSVRNVLVPASTEEPSPRSPSPVSSRNTKRSWLLERSSVPPAAVRAHFTDSPDILELNVGGKYLSVSRSTLLQAPAGSVLHNLFSSESQDRLPQVEGRIFLDLPPDPFARIVDYLRLHRLVCLDDSVKLPPSDAPAESWEFWILARFLGVAELFSGAT